MENLPNPVRATIIESEAYRRTVAQYGNDKAMDEVKESFDFILYNNPEYGVRLPGASNVYMIQTVRKPPRIPSFRILYRYDPEDDMNVVELLHIEPVISDFSWE